MAEKTVAQIFIETLVAAGVTRIFGVVGDSLNGTDFPYTQFYPEKATVIQVDLRGENLGRRTRLDLGIVGDVKATLRGSKEVFVVTLDLAGEETFRQLADLHAGGRLATVC